MQKKKTEQKIDQNEKNTPPLAPELTSESVTEDKAQEQRITGKEIPGMFDGRITPLLIKLALPIAAGMLFQLIYNVVDAVFISLIDKSDPSYFGATGIVFPLIFLGIAVSNGLMVGTSSMVARAIGEKNHEVLDKTAESGIAISAIISIFFLIGTYLFDDKIIGLLGAEGDYAVHGLEYLQYIVPGVVLMFIGNILFGVLQGEGLMKYMMWGMIIGTIGNIILDPIFIFLLDLKVRGAALATVIAQVGSALYVVTLFVKKKTRVPIHWKLKNISMPVIKEIITVGFPQAISMIVMSLTFLIYNRIIIAIDELALTAFALYGRFEQLLFIPVFALGSALVTIVGQNSGRGKLDRCEESWKKSLFIGSGSVIVLAGLFVLFSPFLFRSLSDIPEVVDYAIRETQVLAFSMLFAVLGVFARSIFQAIGHPLPALFLSLLRLIFLGVPAVLVFVYVFDWGIYGVWFGIVAGNGLAGIVSYTMITKAFKRLRDGRLIVKSMK
ncbi:MAG: MATE family efflux transporter [Spirochaetales bacterium]|nr:MATE family efflux transporter [Spirochaetales bacterium]